MGDGMNLAIMQPYFLPYVGYFQLIHSADVFVVYDNIKYTKKGWINRNRILVNGRDQIISIPLKRDSDFLEIREREIAPEFSARKLLAQFRGAYIRAPYFQETYDVLEDICLFQDRNLFGFIRHSIETLSRHLGMTRTFKVSSEVPAEHTLKAEDRVISICHALNASTYINASGGTSLYTRERFDKEGLRLKFNRPKLFPYAQFGGEFVPWLSIIDVLMFLGKGGAGHLTAEQYELVDP